MADSAVDITAGTGTSIDTRTESTNGHHRQVVVVGDPATNAGVAPVDGTAGLKVNLGSDNDVLAAGGSLTAYQGSAPWVVTMATQTVLVGSGSIQNAGGSLSAFQGGNWLVSVATLPVIANIVNSSIPVTQSGTWDEVGINDSGNSITVDGNLGVAGGSISSWAAGGSLSAFQGGAWNVGINAGTNNIGDVDILTIAAGDNNIGNVDAIQSGTWTVQPGNTPNTTAWLVTMATLPVVGTFDVAGQATVTALQGDAGSSAWRVTMATLPVIANVVNSTLAVTQSGTWDEVGINDSGNSITIDGNIGVAGGSISTWSAGGSLSAFQGGAWTVQPGNTPNATAWLVTMATLPVVGEFSVAGQATVTALQGDAGTQGWRVTMATLPVMANIVNSTLAVTQSGTWDEIGINDSGNSITVDGNIGVAGGSISAFNAGGSLSAWNAGGSLSAFQGGTWTVQPGNTPNTTAWLVTMATLPVVANVNVAGQATVTALQGDAGNSPWRVTMATLPVMANVVNSTIAVTQSGTWDEVGINDSGNSITIDGNVGNIGGSLSAYVFGGSISAFNAGGSLSVFQGTPFWQVTMATMPVVGDFSLSGDVGVAGGSISIWGAGGSISSFQSGAWTVQPGNTPNTVAWLVTMATLPVVGTFDVAGQATVTALQGSAGSSPWLVTMATLPVMANVVNTSIAVTQSGTWDEVGINDSGNSITIDGNVGVIGGSISVWNAGGSLSAYNVGGSLTAFQGGTWNVAGSISSYIFGGSLSAWNAGGTVSVYNLGGSISAFQAGTWNVAGSISSYVFGGSLSAFNAGGSISAFQGGPWNVIISGISGTNFVAGGQYLPSLISLTSLQYTPIKLDMFNNQMVNINVPLPNSTKINRHYSIASMASLMAAPGAGKRLVVRELDFSANATLSVKLVEDQGGTPATVWGPHFFLPYAGVTKNQTYIPLTANKSLGIDIQPAPFGAGVDVRVETENS